MITTDAALYVATTPSVPLGGAGAALLAPVGRTCGCGQELLTVDRRHCPRCGCCLS